MHNNQEQWVYCYCHLEVQGYKDDNFSQRMYEYFYRIKDKFHQKVYPLAIYTHDCVDNQPNYYEEKFYGMSLRYEYPTYKVTDPDEAWLKRQDNAFAIAVLACQYALKSKSDLPLRVNFKRELMDLLYQKKWERAKILQFFSYLNVLIRIPSEEENRKAVEAFIEKMSKQGVDDVELKWYTTLVEDAKEEACERRSRGKSGTAENIGDCQKPTKKWGSYRGYRTSNIIAEGKNYGANRQQTLVDVIIERFSGYDMRFRE